MNTTTPATTLKNLIKQLVELQMMGSDPSQTWEVDEGDGNVILATDSDDEFPYTHTIIANQVLEPDDTEMIVELRNTLPEILSVLREVVEAEERRLEDERDTILALWNFESDAQLAYADALPTSEILRLDSQFMAESFDGNRYVSLQQKWIKQNTPGEDSDD